jgi:hypothetical protein
MSDSEVELMAWITVDQKLIGGKLRDFAKRCDISQNEAIGILIRLWLWGIDNADNGGQIIAGEKSDIEEAIRPGFAESEKENVPEVVQSLISCGWIDESEGVLYLHDWMDRRSYYNQYITGKQKHADRMRSYRASKKGEKTPDAPEQEEPKKKGTRNVYAPGFEEFWSAYPRKADKGNAYKKYKARLGDGYSEAELLLAAQNYAAQCEKQRTEIQFIKHPKTFLSDAMPFLDYLDKQQDNAKKLPEGANPFL